MFLTQANMTELTGYCQPNAQKRWLEKTGWEYTVSRFGRPKVLRAYADQKMGLNVVKASTHSEPDFSHWNVAT
jgi:hypothetical protein